MGTSTEREKMERPRLAEAYLTMALAKFDKEKI
jgi:hypothetical protein